MKNRSIITVLIILTLASPLLSEEIEKNIILNSMTFPSPDIKIGSALNDPFFAINIESEKINTEEITEQILSAEKELNDKTVPEKYYQLGNFYKNINNYKNAVKYYKKYLELTASTDIISMEESGKLLVKGEIYYSLSVIDLKKNRADNLEKSLLFFTKAVELNPDNRSIWVKLGDCYLAAGKTTEALYCYNKVLEKNSKDFQIYSRLQAATFQRDYLKLSESKIEDRIEIQPVTQGFDFDYLETSINNSPDEFKEGLKLQHYIYLLRLMLINNNNFQFKSNPGIIKDEETILNEADKLLKSVRKENLDKLKLKYLSGIVNYLKKDYK
ncbi:MAG TPA: tetratricopeptide repeat protein, partial [Spirochaetota bacterium]|nr:tetratricopeptide repeat protein [Spirochaetota bacterium]